VIPEWERAADVAATRPSQKSAQTAEGTKGFFLVPSPQLAHFDFADTPISLEFIGRHMISKSRERTFDLAAEFVCKRYVLASIYGV
jgi:hypothetical protein